ncbi:MAG: TaqI-like C-terminal specificity domain-containing protein [Polaribacter sp.]|uniref:TaqI-like C-terminal specificity domain-containing protein n=1 Tax=Polaribacter sp. TaxID=1920175 RepID=UPI002F3547A5
MPDGKTVIRKHKASLNFEKVINTNIYNQNPIKAFSFEIDNEKQNVLNKVSKHTLLGGISKIKRGIELGQVTELIECNNCGKYSEISTKYYSKRDANKCKYCESKIDFNSKFTISSRKKNVNYSLPCLSGREINRYTVNSYYYIIPNLISIDYKEDIYSNKNLYVKRIATKPEATLVNHLCYTFNTLYSIYDLKINTKESLMLILNSKLISFYYELVFNLGMNLTTQVTVEYLKKIPIAKVLKSDLFQKMSNIILNETNYLNTKSDNFSDYIISQFQLEKLSKKLQNWYSLEFSDFIKEINKAIKNNKQEKLTKLQEMEWMEVFEVKKAEAQTIKTQIDQTDKEIDAMVYELYGLTDDEIKIVENS